MESEEILEAGPFFRKPDSVCFAVQRSASAPPTDFQFLRLIATVVRTAIRQTISTPPRVPAFPSSQPTTSAGLS